MTQFDSTIRERLENFDSPVADSVWQRIEMELVEENNNKVLGYYWMAGLLVIIAITLSTFLYFGGNSDQQEIQTASGTTEHVDEADNNIIVTDSYIMTTKSIETKDSSFIKNMKALSKK